MVTPEGPQGPDARLAGSLTLNSGSCACGGPTRNLTLYLCSDRSPIVGKPFTAIFPDSMRLLHLSFDGLPNVLENHSLYPVWARGLRLALAAKRSSEGNVMLVSEPEPEDTGFGVSLSCYSLRLEVACFKMTPVCHSRRVWHTLAQVKQTMIPLMRPRQLGSEIPNIFLPLKYFPHIASGIWCARNRYVICCVMFIRISCGRAHYLGHTYLIPPWGAHKSIPLKHVVHCTRNHRRVFWEIVQISNSILYVVNKLGSYYRVSCAYLSHLISTPGGVRNV